MLDYDSYSDPTTVTAIIENKASQCQRCHECKHRVFRYTESYAMVQNCWRLISESLLWRFADVRAQNLEPREWSSVAKKHTITGILGINASVLSFNKIRIWGNHAYVYGWLYKHHSQIILENLHRQQKAGSDLLTWWRMYKLNCSRQNTNHESSDHTVTLKGGPFARLRTTPPVVDGDSNHVRNTCARTCAYSKDCARNQLFKSN